MRAHNSVASSVETAGSTDAANLYSELVVANGPTPVASGATWPRAAAAFSRQPMTSRHGSALRISSSLAPRQLADDSGSRRSIQQSQAGLAPPQRCAKGTHARGTGVLPCGQ